MREHFQTGHLFHPDIKNDEVDTVRRNVGKKRCCFTESLYDTSG